MRERYFIYVCDRILFKSDNDYVVEQDDIEDFLDSYGYKYDSELSQIILDDGVVESCVDTGTYLMVYERDFRGFILDFGANIILSTVMIDKINETVKDDCFVTDGEVLEIHKYIVNDFDDSIDYYFRAFKVKNNFTVVFSGSGDWRLDG